MYIRSSGILGLFLFFWGGLREVLERSDVELDDWEGVQVLLDGLSVEVGLSDREVREE